MECRRRVVFYLNGSKIEVENPDPTASLLSYIRRTQNLTGTKYGCGEGYCGACTVMLSWYDRSCHKIRNESVVSCLLSLVSVHGKSVTTIEALGSVTTRLHPIQERLAKSHGTQCGFCSPGMVMSMYTLLRNNPHPSMEQIQNAIKGNLCRCTGYRPILDAFNTFAEEFKCSMGDQCCKNKSNTSGAVTVVPSLLPLEGFTQYDSTQEPIFPSELQVTDHYDKESLKFEKDDQVWFRPSSYGELLKIKNEHPTARLIAGNTGRAFIVNKTAATVNIFVGHLSELQGSKASDTGLTVGAAVTLSEMKSILEGHIQQMPKERTKLLKEIVSALEPIESEQILNAATIGGHVAVASPISDLIPVMVAGRCLVTTASRDFSSKPVDLINLFNAHGGPKLTEGDIIKEVHIPFSQENEYFACLSQKGSRIDLSTTVNAGMKVEIDPETNRVKDIDMVFNGLNRSAARRCRSSRDIAIGQMWNEKLLEQICASLLEELAPSMDGSRVKFRQSMLVNHFVKFYNMVVQHSLSNDDLPDEQFQPKCGNQIFSDVSKDQPVEDAIGRPIAHLAAEKHVTGQAQYVDDIPSGAGELFLAMVTSTEAHAKIVKIDTSVALGMPGVKGVTTHADAVNNIHDDVEIFASDVVHCVGQLIVGVLAETRAQAFRAAGKVIIEYEPVAPTLTIKDAIEKESFMGPPLEAKEGDIEKGFSESQHVIEGEVEIGGQLHFYLETHSVLVVPKDGNEYEVFASTQNPRGIQAEIATALGVAQHKVCVRTKRVGGSFGGKESQGEMVSTPCAIAAAKFKQPVRCVLPRYLDKPVTGGRHPMLAKYRAGVDNNGKLQALEAKYYTNGGWSMDLSMAVLLKHMEANFFVYNVPNVSAFGRVCRTNLPSNTAFRGFGIPQGMFIWQNIVDHIAHDLEISPMQVQEINFHEEGGVMPCYGQKLNFYNLSKVWTQLKAESDMERRKIEIDEFNRNAKYKKRGIAMTPMAFSPAFPFNEFNQATALVHVYLDGSVLLSHGGVEMGQGLHTKTVQIASRVLGVPVEMIHKVENSTAQIANSSTTAASGSTDLNGVAVQRACQTIADRLKPFRERKPDATWKETVRDAYKDQVSLSATGHFGWRFRESGIIPYLTFGAACSEVEVDCLTGDHKLLRTDIVMDIGQSLNPAIDVGQIEGAFVQGCGLFTKEEEVFNEKGSLLTRGPLTYRIPRCTDIPGQLNVHLLKDCPNETPVYSSKAIGEPPFVLSLSAYCAIKAAVAAARSEHGLTEYFQLNAPASAEKIVIACSARKM